MKTRILVALFTGLLTAADARAQSADAHCDTGWLAKAQGSSADSGSKDYVDAAAGRIKFPGAACSPAVLGSGLNNPAGSIAAQKAEARSRAGVAAAQARADRVQDPFAVRPSVAAAGLTDPGKARASGAGFAYSARGSGTPGSGAYRARPEVPTPDAAVDKRLQAVVAKDERKLRAYVTANVASLEAYKKSLGERADAAQLVAAYRSAIQQAEAKFRGEVREHEAAFAKMYRFQDIAKQPHDALGFPLFRTADEAAIAAARLALIPTRASVKKRDRHEYGGLILKNKSNGEFSFTHWIRGGDHSIDLNDVPVPDGYVRAGSYHTHPHGFIEEDGVGASGEDVVNARNHNESGYLVEAVIGNVYRYDGFDPKRFPAGRQVAIASLGEQ